MGVRGLNEIVMVDDINNIIAFLAKRDINDLSSKELFKKFCIEKVDLIIILGNSMPYIAELGAKAYKSGLAKDIMLVGGIGHSTKYLIENVMLDDKYKDISVVNKSEADILSEIIVKAEDIKQDKIIIESKSTNCGSNAYEALNILRVKGRIPKSIILIQDPTMQLRSHLSFLKEWKEEKTLIISYSPFIPKVRVLENGYEYTNKEINGLWTKDRFIDLIMGEVPRLKDDENGYGPRGKDFISHVEVPRNVIESYKRLLSYYNEYNQIKIRI
jgi:uncharacterized SAM-binding protein YcdF (DUF218 family)